MTGPGRPGPLAAGLYCRCPNCGRGPLYEGVLTVRERCLVCGADLRSQEAGDGAAAFVIFFLGAIVVGLAIWLEFAYAPPLWLHAAIWPAVVLGGSVWLTRMAKATLIAMQFRYRPGDFDDR